MVIYQDHTKTMPWLIGQVQSVGSDTPVLDVHRYGSYALHKRPESDVKEWTFQPAYRDVKDDALVYTSKPTARLRKTPQRDIVWIRDVVTRNFFLTNKKKIPMMALKAADETFSLL